MPPTGWLLGNRGGWTHKDYLLSLVLEIYLDGLCGCGQPTILAHHPDNEGWYDAKKVQCQSCASRERATQGSGTEAYQPDPGEKVYTTFSRDLEKKPLPPRT